MTALLTLRPLRRLSMLALALLIGACESPTAPDMAQEDVVDLPVSEHRRGGPVRRPFRARLTTELAGLAPDARCAADRLLNTQVGEGRATQLGRFTAEITFCVDLTDLMDDGMLTEGESLPYDNGQGTLVAANGDQLFVRVSGAVLPSTRPGYDFEFHDVFVFVGGTGRFEGARGRARAHSFVNGTTNVTDHRWAGKILLSPHI